MRRILFPLLVIGLAGGLFTLGSGAFFSDKQSDTGNTITAGSLLLSIGGNGSVNCSIGSYQPTSLGNVTFDGVLPTCQVTGTNAGTLDGDLYLKVVVTNDDNGCAGGSPLGPEALAGDVTCGPTGGGELGGQLHILLCKNNVAGTSTLGIVAADQPCNSLVDIVSDTHLLANTLAQGCLLVASPLKPGGANKYSLEFDFADEAVTNLSQTDSFKVDMYFELVSVGAPAPSCS